MPGHGLSSPIPDGMYYHMMDMMILLRKLQKHFGWPKISFMGHSLGAVTSYNYASTFPKDVDFIICIEALKALEVRDLPARRAKFIDDYLKYEKIRNLPPRPYTMEKLAEMYHMGSLQSVDLDKCIYLLKRNTVAAENDPGRYYITRDPRVKASNMFNFPDDEMQFLAKQLTMPILYLMAKQSSFFDRQVEYSQIMPILKSSPNFQLHEVDGTHHVHLNNPERLKDTIRIFLNKYYVQN